MFLLSPLSSPRGWWPVLLSLALPLASRAQTVPAPEPAAPHLFVGLGAGVLQYQLPGGYTVNLHTLVPALMPTVGLAFGPRWSLQVSGAYRARTEAGGYTVSRFGPQGQAATVTYSSRITQRTWAVPLLARYALCAPAHRWQFDVLGGVTLVHDAFRRAATTDSAEARIATTDQTTRRVGVQVALGLGVRYALTPRLALTGDALVTRIVNAAPPQGNAVAPSLVLGLRYDVGRRK